MIGIEKDVPGLIKIVPRVKTVKNSVAGGLGERR